MRKLTIKREKTFVACLSPIQLYIEDHSTWDMTINNYPCRKLGTVKNGQEVSFEIGEESARVFAIAGATSKSFCTECYVLPQGQEDLYLSGKNKFNLANGNAFRFHNNDSEEALQYRKASSRKGAVVLVVALVVGLALGYFVGGGLTGSDMDSPKAFTEGELQITLTEGFRKMDFEGFTVCYGSEDVAVFALKEPFSLLEGFENYTLEEYGALFTEANGIEPEVLKMDGDRLYCAYKGVNQENGLTYAYIAYGYKTDDAFWLIQFGGTVEDMEENAQQIPVWADSIKIS